MAGIVFIVAILLCVGNGHAEYAGLGLLIMLGLNDVKVEIEKDNDDE